MAGMSDLGGVKFFNLAVETPEGDIEVLELVMQGEQGAGRCGALLRHGSSLTPFVCCHALLSAATTGMNAEVDEAAEERKGGSGHLGKMLLSAGQSTVRPGSNTLAASSSWCTVCAT